MAAELLAELVKPSMLSLGDPAHSSAVLSRPRSPREFLSVLC